MLRIFLSAERGFCSGVKRAVALALSEACHAAENGKKAYILHELVHNRAVVEDLAARGVFIVDSPEGLPENSTLIFSAHGVSERIENRARALPLHVADATCPLVRHVHSLAAELRRQGYRILLAGKRGHRETEGILGRIPDGTGFLLESEKEAEAFRPEPDEKYALLSQTTFLSDAFERIRIILTEKIPSLHTENTICPSTLRRQRSVRNLAARFSAVAVVGSAGSSNSRRLCETARTEGAEAFLLEAASGIPERLRSFSGTLALTSGASASEEEVQAVLKQLLALPGAEFAGETCPDEGSL